MRRTPCPGCRGLFDNHDNHRRQSKCGQLTFALAQYCDEEPVQATRSCPEDNFLPGFDDDAAAGDVAFALADLKYGCGFQRPDVDAAKSLASAVGKRTREMAFDHLKDLLRPGVDSMDVMADLSAFCLPADCALGPINATDGVRGAVPHTLAMCCARPPDPWNNDWHALTLPPCPCAVLEAAAAKAYRGVETEKQEKAYLRRNLPTLEVRETDLGVGADGLSHRIASVNTNDAVIRLLQESRKIPLSLPNSVAPADPAVPTAAAGPAAPTAQ